MDGEIDLELYTVSIIRLNNIFQKVENKENIAEINNNLLKCINDFYKLYKDIVDDFKEGKINCNEYDPFFENGLNTFPTYMKKIEELFEKTDNDEFKDNLTVLLTIFSKLIKVGNEYYKQRGVQ